jgi:hypothetical protein
MSGDE